MSLYRQARGRSGGTLVAAVVIALVAGGVAGFALGRSTAPDETLADLVAEARADARPALGALELVAIEYSEAVRGGEVVAETEYQAATAQADAAAATIAGARELAALDPAQHGRAERAVAELERLVGRRADPRQVEAAAGEARLVVAELAGAEPELAGGGSPKPAGG